MERKHILMVDDLNTNLKSAAETLHDYYDISMVRSGLQALRFLSRTIPDLILLDIEMPEMDGYETLQRIRSNSAWSGIPVIFLTADTDGESEIKGLQMGAVDYIRKPFVPQIMLSRINRAIQIAQEKHELEVCARVDALTGLWNRRYLDEKLQEFTDSDSHSTGTFMLMDMDNFKAVNDNLGHLVGDAVLVYFAKMLRQLEDEHTILARIGGDEFVVYIDGLNDVDRIREIANYIITNVVDQVNLYKGGGHDISISIGIAMMPDNGINLRTLYNKADKALYFVKENGKRGYHFFQERDKTGADRNKSSQNSSKADIVTLKMLISEKNKAKGAYEVEYDGFRKIYQFLSRSVKRSKRNVQMVLFTLNERADAIQEIGGLEMAMQDLNSAIVNSLRRGDVATQYSSTQYIVILMDTDITNGSMVAERIMNSWKGNSMVGCACFDISFDIEQFETEEETSGEY